MYPQDLKYTDTHEWVRTNGNMATVGITDHAQSELGDVVYVELPEIGAEVKKGSPFGTIESVKTVSDLVAAVSGRITQVNNQLPDKPEMANEEPYGSGWLAVVEMSDPSELDSLMSSDQYESFIGRK